MVVDAHLHVFAAASERFPRDVHELYPAELEAPVESLIAVMEEAGVDRAVLVPLSHHDEYLQDCLRRFPGRFAAIGLQPAGETDVDGYRRRRESVGLRGLRLFELGDPSISHPEDLPSFPILAELAETGDKLWFYGDGAQMALLERVLTALPELAVVLNHLGFWPSGLWVDGHGRPRFARGYTEEGLAAVERLARFRRVFVLFSGLYAFSEEPCPYDDLRWVTTALLAAFGPSRLLLASDFPWIAVEPGYAETLGVIDAHFPDLDPAGRNRIRGGNAVDLFGFS
jgi:predicted TIM-barrel fold metal-dependent hydrolase